MKKYFLLLGILTSTLYLKAQTDSLSNNDKIVTLTVTGQGKTIDEAKINALRSAIEQAFGAFVSSKTTILNDSLIKDEIVSVSNGNIQKYEVLNETPSPDGSYATTLKAIVSVSKLTSFCESKGVEVEFKGGLFSINIKQQILNEKAELKAIWETLFFLNPIINQSFDYTIKTSEPKSLDDRNLNWEIPITVSVISNKNIDFVFGYLKNMLKNTSLKPQEVENYKSLGKDVYTITLDTEIFYFRKKETQTAVRLFFGDLPRITKNFIVEDGLSNLQGYWYSKMNNLAISYKIKDIYYDREDVEPNIFYEYDMSNNIVQFNEPRFKSIRPLVSIVDISFTRNYSLNELEKLSKIQVHNGYSKTKIGTWYHGGRIYFIDSQSNAYISPIIDSYIYSLDNEIDERRGVSLIGIPSERVRTPNLRLSKIFTDTSTGSGYTNSLKLLKDKYASLDNSPAGICHRYSSLDFNDWFLPSKNELDILYRFHNYFCNATPLIYYSPSTIFFYNHCISSSQVDGSEFYCKGNRDGYLSVDYFDNVFNVDVIPIRWEKFPEGSYLEELDIQKHLDDSRF
jgi:hypothetical protein